MIKKIVALLLILTLAFSVIGCGNQGEEEEAVFPHTLGIAAFSDYTSLNACKRGILDTLEEEGFIKDENIKIINTNAQLDFNTTDRLCASLMAQDVDMICAIGTPMAQSALKATKDTKIPTVFAAVTDPEGAKLTKGNITGTSDKINADAQLQMIRSFLPEAKTIGIIYCTKERNAVFALEQYKTLAANYGFTVKESPVEKGEDIPLAADRLLLEVDCMINLPDNTVTGSLPTILKKAKALEKPVFGSDFEQVKDGCIAAVGIDYYALGQATGKIICKMLNDKANASDIPWDAISETQLYYNPDALETYNMILPENLKDKAVDMYDVEEE